MKINATNSFGLNRFNQYFTLQNLCYFILFIGVLIRIHIYRNALPIWGDEASLMYNIIHRNYLDLLKPLEYLQMAPAFFMFFEKMMIDVFGRSEYSVRFLMLLAGCGSLFLFLKLLRMLNFSWLTTVISISFLVFSPLGLLYSFFIKQYGIDIFFFLAIFVVYNPWKELNITWKRVVGWSILGVLAVLFSHPAAFTIFAVGGSLLIKYYRKKEFKQLYLLILILAIIVAIFTINYLFTVILNNNTSPQLGLYPKGFLFFRRGFGGFIQWCGYVYEEIWYKGIGIKETSFFTFLGIMAIIGLYKEKRNALLILVPFVTPFLINFTKAYPIYPGKFLFYAAPAIILLVAYGIEYTTNSIRSQKIVALSITVFLLIPMAQKTNYSKSFYDDIRKPMQELSKEVTAQDTVYVFMGAIRSFDYYYPVYFKENKPTIVYGNRPWKPDIQKISKHQKIWVLFSYLNDDYNTGDDRKGMLDLLKQNGKMEKEFVAGTTSIHKFVFKQESVHNNELSNN